MRKYTFKFIYNNELITDTFEAISYLKASLAFTERYPNAEKVTLI